MYIVYEMREKTNIEEKKMRVETQDIRTFKIEKISSEENDCAFCDRCGANIKNVYKIKGISGVFGQECIKRIIGIPAKRILKNVDAKYFKINLMKNNGQIKEYSDIFNLSESEVIEGMWEGSIS